MVLLLSDLAIPVIAALSRSREAHDSPFLASSNDLNSLFFSPASGLEPLSIDGDVQAAGPRVSRYTGGNKSMFLPVYSPSIASPCELALCVD
jgi:hypothetical protein